MRTREKRETFVLSREQVKDMAKLQNTIVEEGFEDFDDSKLITGLSIGGTVGSFLFSLPNPVTLTAGVIAVLSGNVEPISDACERLANEGQKYTLHLKEIIEENSQIDYIKVELPIFEFVDDDLQFVMSEGIVEKVRAYHSWVSPNQFPDIEWDM